MFNSGTGRGPGIEPGGAAGGGRGSYAGIASINTSVRDKKNVLEVRLERTEDAKFNLSTTETESLLVKLGIDSSHFLGVSCCPEGKGVVYITLHPSVNITRFLYKQESYILKEGVQTTVIRPAGKKELSVFIYGLHPNTKDQAVIRYLSAHGKVSQKYKVVHHVYPGGPGTSLLAGKLNGDRSYMMEVSKPLGSYHIIDGEKVSVKYRGQVRTCARCHQTEKQCSGKGIARDCRGDRVLLSSHMEKHWKEIGFLPETNSSLEEEEDDLEIQVGQDKIDRQLTKGPNLSHRYSSVIVSGFSAEQNLAEVHELLLNHGVPQAVKCEDLLQNKKTGKLTIENISPTECLSIMEKIHGKKFLGKKIYVTSVVSASPVKSTAAQASLGPPPPCPPPPPPASSLPLDSSIKLKITQILKPTITNISLVPVVILKSVADDNPPGLDSSSGSGSDSDTEPATSFRSIQDKINVFDPPAPDSKFYRKRTESEKRKLVESPDKPDLTKAEKRILKRERKKLRKLEHQQHELLTTKQHNGN